MHAGQTAGCQPREEIPTVVWFRNGPMCDGVKSVDTPKSPGASIPPVLMDRRFFCVPLFSWCIEAHATNPMKTTSPSNLLFEEETKYKVATRINDENLNHHIWNNNGSWWVHFTLHLPNHTKARRRRTLRTNNVFVARRRRDLLFEELQNAASQISGSESNGAAA